MVPNVQLTGSVPNIARKESPIIGFSEEFARRLHHPHDDALVVSVRVGDCNVHRMLVDNGSSADILFYLAFQQIGIDKARLIPTIAPLVGFGGTRVLPLGAITLSVTVGDYPQQITKDVTFLVVDCSSAYNGILGRPTLNLWKAATSTYHLMIKFPTEYGIGDARGPGGRSRVLHRHAGNRGSSADHVHWRAADHGRAGRGVGRGSPR